MTRDKALVINKFWGSVLGSVMAALAIGGFSFAWTVNAQMTKLEVLDNAHLPERLSRIEEKLDYLKERITNMER